MRRLRKLGCNIALDDFGTGLSSLAYLRTLPIGMLKIDGSFVRDVLKDPRAESMVQAIAQLARAMNADDSGRVRRDRRDPHAHRSPSASTMARASRSRGRRPWSTCSRSCPCTLAAAHPTGMFPHEATLQRARGRSLTGGSLAADRRHVLSDRHVDRAPAWFLRPCSDWRSACRCRWPAGCWPRARRPLPPPGPLAGAALPWDDARLLAEVIQRVRENYVDAVDDHKLMQNAIRGMVEALDDHSTFLSPDEFEDMQGQHQRRLRRHRRRGSARQGRRQRGAPHGEFARRSAPALRPATSSLRSTT